jgi:hypothetical protein
VPPIFQPEVAAEAIVHAADHPRRELVVAWPAAKAIYGDKVAQGLVDRYLARTGYDSQQDDEPLNGQRAGNLFEPVPGSFAAHGRFDDEAKPRSLLLDVSLRRGPILAGATLAGALLLARRAWPT